jgi:conjugal transfer pilus assembly protein TraV
VNRLLAIVVCISLASCTVKYRCQGVPNDAGCRNMSEVYDRTGESFVDSRGKSEKSKKNIKSTGVNIKTSRNAINAVIAGEPVLTKAEGLRIWIAPWSDKNKDLHFSYVYIRTKDAEWTLLK